MKRLPDGIVLLHARSALVNQDQLLTHGFHQDPSFYYFTGLPNAVGAILAVDGPARESWLFVPTELSGMAAVVRNPFIQAGTESVTRLMIEHVVRWDQFASYIDRRFSADPNLIFYTDDTGAFMFSPSPESNPPGLAPIEDSLLLWRNALVARWPKATIRSASKSIRNMRLVKSEAEIQVMRRVSKVSAGALLASLRKLRPGLPQRQVEAEIVGACMGLGGEGPSFWPLAATGPNSGVPMYLEALADYHHMNRVMGSGDLVHLDLGCEVDHYGGDVGRTVPVSGRFDPGQRETWELLVRAYQAGLATMRDGVRRQDVFAVSIREIERLANTVRNPLTKKAVAKLLGKDGTQLWYMHSSGIECCETEPEVLRSGMVVVFEPSVTVDGQGFYLEDMILITPSGYEILTAGLPYSADEIESLMTTKADRKSSR